MSDEIIHCCKQSYQHVASDRFIWDMQELNILVDTSESIHIEDAEEMGG
jgi:hypothetical protein